MTTTIITMLAAALVASVAACWQLYLLTATQRKLTEYTISQGRLLIANFQFLNASMEMTLWKVRQEVYSWQSQWAKADQFEAAKQAQTVVTNISTIIKKYHEQLQEDERKV